MWLLPFLEGRPKPAGPTARAVERAATALLARPPKTGFLSRPVLAGVAFLILVSALCFGHALDDVRRFQTPSASLTAEEAHISALTGFAPTSEFLLVRGASLEDEARNEEALRARLGPAGSALLAASAFMPDAATVARDQSLIRTALLAPELPP
jgi:predicted exporter